MNPWKQSVRRLTRFSMGQDEPPAERVPAGGWFVLTGTCLGAALALAGALGAWMGGSKAGFLVAGISVFAAEIWLTRGRGSKALIAALEQRLGAARSEEVAIYVRLCSFQAAMMAKAACFAVLCGRGLALWLPLTYALAAASEWIAIRRASRPGSTADRSPREVTSTWVLAGAVALLTAAWSQALFAGALAVLVAWLLPKAVCRVLAWDEEALEDELRWEISVLALLTVGMLAALG